MDWFVTYPNLCEVVTTPDSGLKVLDGKGVETSLYEDLCQEISNCVDTLTSLSANIECDVHVN